MYILQLCNAFTQEIIREQEFTSPEVLMGCLTTDKPENAETYIFDKDKRTWLGEYVTHTIHQEGNNQIYKAFYKLRLSPIQAVIKSR